MKRLIFSKKVERFLAKTQESDQRLFDQFIQALNKISENPYVGKKLVGNLAGYYSYRVSDYRIIFEIKKGELLVYIEKIGHRRDVYK